QLIQRWQQQGFKLRSSMNGKRLMKRPFLQSSCASRIRYCRRY
ncbi:hypothetical protein Goklo_000816, partial [Gossypium klotzschianum]|nr:hypothetical protein [Gossypium klotzschianum]